MSSVPPEDQKLEEVEQEVASDDGMPEHPAKESGPEARLVVKRGGVETEEVFVFGSPAVIGRFDVNAGPVDVDLGTIPEGVYVSRKHAVISFEDGVWKVTDLGSSNGTYLLRDGEFQRVEEAALEDGVEIALGNAKFVFRFNDSAQDA